MRRRTLMLVSGGLDSTTAAFKLLRETDDDIHIHFIDYRTDHHRHRAEAQAVARLIPKWREVREFEYTSTKQDYSKLGSPVDLHMYCFTAAQVVRMRPEQMRFDRVATGLVRNDRAIQWAHRRAVAESIFNACLADWPEDERPTWCYPCFDMTKADAIKYLGPELYALTWSCRRPIEVGESYARCGECLTCNQLHEAETSAQV